MGKRFENKVVVITGAGGVLCSAFAQAFAAEGAKTALLDLNEDIVLKNAAALTQQGYTAKAYKADVLDTKSLEGVREKINEDFGTCDILINGAGGNNPRATTDNEFHTTDIPEGTKTFFDLEKSGIILPTQVFAKDMLNKKGANIINISSMNAYTPLTKIPAYSGAKAAVSNFTQWLAVHFSKTGIRCNAIAPGFLVGNQNRSLLFDADGNPTPRAKKILNNTPMGRFGETSELLGALLFLADETQAAFINGVILPIDGGFNAYSGV